MSTRGRKKAPLSQVRNGRVQPQRTEPPPPNRSPSASIDEGGVAARRAQEPELDFDRRRRIEDMRALNRSNNPGHGPRDSMSPRRRGLPADITRNRSFSPEYDDGPGSPQYDHPVSPQYDHPISPQYDEESRSNSPDSIDINNATNVKQEVFEKQPDVPIHNACSQVTLGNQQPATSTQHQSQETHGLYRAQPDFQNYPDNQQPSTSNQYQQQEMHGLYRAQPLAQYYPENQHSAASSRYQPRETGLYRSTQRHELPRPSRTQQSIKRLQKKQPPEMERPPRSPETEHFPPPSDDPLAPQNQPGPPPPTDFTRLQMDFSHPPSSTRMMVPRYLQTNEVAAHGFPFPNQPPTYGANPLPAPSNTNLLSSYHQRSLLPNSSGLMMPPFGIPQPDVGQNSSQGTSNAILSIPRNPHDVETIRRLTETIAFLNSQLTRYTDFVSNTLGHLMTDDSRNSSDKNNGKTSSSKKREKSGESDEDDDDEQRASKRTRSRSRSRSRSPRRRHDRDDDDDEDDENKRRKDSHTRGPHNAPRNGSNRTRQGAR